MYGSAQSVGTKATVKTVAPDELRTLGAQIVLGNTYHLHFRPGDGLIADALNESIGLVVESGCRYTSALKFPEYAQYSRQPIPKPDQIQPPAENSAAPYFTSWLRQQLVDLNHGQFHQVSFGALNRHINRDALFGLHRHLVAAFTPLGLQGREARGRVQRLMHVPDQVQQPYQVVGFDLIGGI